MPVVVRKPPAAPSIHTTLDVPETQVLVGYPQDPIPYHHRLLISHIAEARWVLCTPTGNVFEDDLAGEDVVPLTQSSQFPGSNFRNIFAFDHVGEDDLRA
jgi:hypothetical protein